MRGWRTARRYPVKQAQKGRRRRVLRRRRQGKVHVRTGGKVVSSLTAVAGIEAADSLDISMGRERSEEGREESSPRKRETRRSSFDLATEIGLYISASDTRLLGQFMQSQRGVCVCVLSCA